MDSGRPTQHILLYLRRHIQLVPGFGVQPGPSAGFLDPKPSRVLNCRTTPPKIQSCVSEVKALSLFPGLYKWKTGDAIVTHCPVSKMYQYRPY